MPYDLNEVRMDMGSFYTEDYNEYDNIWAIDDMTNLDSIDQNRNPVNILQMRFKRKLKNYLYTVPSYIVYILTLLMFLLPQNSNQRIIIGKLNESLHKI